MDKISRIVRTIAFKDKYTRSTPIFYEFKMLKLSDIHSLKLLCFVYDCIRGSPLQPFDKLFTPLTSIHSYNTRQASKGDIFFHSVNTIQYRKRSARFAGTTLWNNLPCSLRNAHSVPTSSSISCGITIFPPTQCNLVPCEIHSCPLELTPLHRGYFFLFLINLLYTGLPQSDTIPLGRRVP